MQNWECHGGYIGEAGAILANPQSAKSDKSKAGRVLAHHRWTAHR